MKFTNFFSTRSLVVFFVNLVAAFLMAILPHLNWNLSLASPQAPIDRFEQITPKLENKENKFYPKIDYFPKVLAVADYDQAQAYGVIDLETGTVLAQKNFSKKLPIASLTKIMTAVVALDLASPSEQFTVSQLASAQIPTKVMLKSGETYSLEFLLRSALISSANDSAQVIKEGIDQKYKEQIFIRAMNKKAKFLGMKNTHFSNPQGFDSKDNYSTVEDLSILSYYALNYPLIAQIVQETVDDQTLGGADMRFYLQNWNGLMGVYPGVLGLKIGNTGAAGYTTAVVSEREGKKLLAVVLGAPGVLERDLWAAKLLDLGFSQVGNSGAVNISKEQLKQKYASWQYFN